MMRQLFASIELGVAYESMSQAFIKCVDIEQGCCCYKMHLGLYVVLGVQLVLSFVQLG